MSFGGMLKQSTAANVIIGPFVDSTNGDDEETGLTIAQADVRLSKNAGADAQKNDNTSAAHEGDGFYMCELDATDTNTVGQLTLWVHVAGALAVRHDYQVVEEAVFDALFGASALGYVANAPVNVAQFGGSNGTFASGIPAVNAVQISGDSTAADNLENAYDDAPGAVPWHGIVDQGTTQSITGTGAVLRSAAAFPNDVLIGMVFSVLFNGTWQHRVITDNALSGDTITFDALTETPTGTLPYKIWGAPPVASNNGLATAAALSTVEGKIDTIDTNVDAILVDTGTTLQGELDGIQADTEDIQSRLPAALVSGRIDASVGAMANGTVTAAAIATGAIDADAIADNAIDAGSIADGAITAAKIATDAIDADALADGAITAATFAAGAIDATAIASNAITAAKIASDAITAAKIAADAITAAKLASDVTDEIWAKAMTEPSGVPAVNGSAIAALSWLLALARNRMTQTATTQTLRNDANNADLATSTHSDDGTTHVRGEWA